MIFFCVFGFSDALFQLCHLRSSLHWGIVDVFLVFWHIASCLRHTQTSWLRQLKPRPVSKWHFVMPTCHPFSARPTLTRPSPPPHGPYSRDELQTKSPAFLPNSLRGLHQRSSPPILQTSSAACTPMRLKRIRCSALTGVMTVDACCNFQPPLQVDTHRTACTVAVFFTSNDVPALGLASQLSGFSSHHQGEGLEDLTVSPVPLSAACTHSTLMPLSFSWNTCATTLTHIRCYIHLKME